jgi:hypothetical protein
MTLWLIIFAVPVAVFLIVAIDSALEWRDRRRAPEPCSHFHRCEECQ